MLIPTLQDLPRRLESMADTIGKGKVTVKLDVFSEKASSTFVNKWLSNFMLLISWNYDWYYFSFSFSYNAIYPFCLSNLFKYCFFLRAILKCSDSCSSFNLCNSYFQKSLDKNETKTNIIRML